MESCLEKESNTAWEKSELTTENAHSMEQQYRQTDVMLVILKTKGREGGRQREKHTQRSLICWLTLQIPAQLELNQAKARTWKPNSGVAGHLLLCRVCNSRKLKSRTELGLEPTHSNMQ